MEKVIDTPWYALKERQPDDGALVIATNGKARWMDIYYPKIAPMRWNEHIATHWFPVPAIYFLEDIENKEIAKEKMKDDERTPPCHKPRSRKRDIRRGSS
jgi:hypothetical protein